MTILCQSSGGVPPYCEAGEVVIALHCSGADGRQWRALATALQNPFHLIAPDFYGTADNAAWGGDHAFTLADEAAPILDLIDGIDGPVHLVGHSYGGGVALHAALRRPEALASLTLYEPSAFHLLRQGGGDHAESFDEIRQVAETSAAGMVSGDYRSAARQFVDYWGGPGTWARLRPSLQSALTRWMPKAPLDFHALIEEPTALGTYASLEFPALILRGEFAPRPTAAVASLLADVLPDCRRATIAGAGHMGPVTHAEEVAGQIQSFLDFNSVARSAPAAAG